MDAGGDDAGPKENAIVSIPALPEFNIILITTRYRKTLCELLPTADVQLPRTVILRQTARDVDRRRSYLRPDEGQFVLSYHGLN